MKNLLRFLNSTGAALLLLGAPGLLPGQTAQAPALGVVQTIIFAHQVTVGATPPPAQTVHLWSSPASLPFTATVSTQSGGNWLLVNQLLQVTGNTGANGQDLSISVAPNVQPGTYTGTIAITSGATTQNITVTLYASTTGVPRLSPASIVTTQEAGRTSITPVNVTSTGQALTWSADVIGTSPATSWLRVFPNFGDTGTQTNIFVDAGNIPPGATTLAGVVRFSSGTSQVTLPVFVSLGAATQLVVTPTTVSFPYQFGGAAPTVRSVSVNSSTSTQLTYTAAITSSSPWLSLATTPAGPGTTIVTSSTPGTLYLIPNLSTVGQTPGTQEATIRLTAGSISQDITAKLVVSTQPQLVLGQNAVTFAYTLGGTVPTAQTFQVGSTSGVQAYTATPEYTNDKQFFTVSPQTGGFTPGNLTVAINPTVLAGLTAGTYSGNVKITSATGAVENVPVTVTVSGSALITVTPIAPDPFQGPPPFGERTLIVASTDGSNQPFSVAVEYTGSTTGWLNVSPATGTTGTSGAIRYNVTSSAITTPGTYDANIVITPTGVAGAPAVRVPIRYVVAAASVVTPTPARLDLTQNGTTVPAEQTIALAGPNVTYFVRSTQPWIRVAAIGDSIPGNIRVTFDTSALTPGDYAGEIVVTPSGLSDVRIPVTLRVQAGATLQVNPQALTFAFTQGGTNPAAQNLTLASSGAAIPFTATATTQSGGNWLTVTPATGTTGATGAAAVTISVAADPTGLAAGTYRGTVRIASANASNTPIDVNVTLTVGTQSAPTSVVISHAATGAAGGVSPGEIVTIKGRNMAPAVGVEGKIVNNVVQTALGEVSVTFDGIAAPLLYVGPAGDRQGDQINAIVPYEIAGRATSRMVVSYRGVRSDPVELQVRESNPGIFTTSQTGSGQAAVLNQNNTVNSTANPAVLGSVVQIFATGEGQLTPAGTTGQVITTVAERRRPLGIVTAQIGGQSAAVEYAGSAPTLVSGVLQVNVRIPANLPNITGTTGVSVRIFVGGQPSPAGVTIAVRP